MAKISHCGKWTRATEYRILSSLPAYKYQVLYEATCKGKCRKRLRYWVGEFADGRQTDLIPVSAEEFKTKWKRRIKTEKPIPKIQITSDYTQRIRGDIEKQLEYLKKIEWAQSLSTLPPEMTTT